MKKMAAPDIVLISDIASKPSYRLLNRFTRPSSKMTVEALPLKKGWFPDQISTVYDFWVPLVVSTSSPLQYTCNTNSVHELLLSTPISDSESHSNNGS